MKQKWQKIKSSFWFLPTVLIVCSSFISVGLIQIDKLFFESINQQVPLLFSGTPDAARGLLSTIATSVATIVTLIYSITIVALQLSSSQYSSRVLRTFTSDKGFQFVLGIYIATYVSSLLILRSVRSTDGDISAFVPQIAITFVLLLISIDIGSLIYFIDKLARTLQVSEIIQRIYRDISNELNSIYPSSLGKKENDVQASEEIIKNIKPKAKFTVYSHQTGFVQSIDEESLNINTYSTEWIYIKPQVGTFLTTGAPIALLSSLPKDSEKNTLINKIRKAVEVGSQRTIENDVLFGIRQLVDISLRVISNNDQTTVEYTLYYINDILGRLAQKRFPENKRQFKNNPTIFIFNRPTWEDYINASLTQIRQQIIAYPNVAKVYLKMLEHVVQLTSNNHRMIALKDQFESFKKEAPESLLKDKEIKALIKQLEQLS